jgi:hypothetical protein
MRGFYILIKNNFTGRYYFLILFLLTIAMLIVSCNSNHEKTGYAVFKFKEDDIRFKLKNDIIYEHPLFTFEYPRSFGFLDMNGLDFGFSPGITEVEFNREGKGELEYLFSSNITVQVCKEGFYEGETDPDSSVALKVNEHITDANFKVLQEGLQTISGNDAKYVYFLCYHSGDISWSNPLHDRIDRFSCFELNGFLWKIEMLTFQEEDAEVAPYYQHLLDTFTITYNKPTYKGPYLP